MVSKRIFRLILFLLIAETIVGQCPKLIWSDEFDGADLDQTKWSYQIGDGCDINLCQWGNSELQWYTNSRENVDVSNGTLKIKALRQNIQNRAYTSGRIRSLNKGDIKYGRIEARMKMPVGQGIWPAFWMMPTDNVYGPWPQSGELDIMELLGHEPDRVHGTIHFGNPWPNNASSTKSLKLPVSKLNEAFHDYVLEWKEGEIKWIVDGYVYSTKNMNDVGGLRWPFDQKFHFLFNLAVGGQWPGSPDGSTVFPQVFEIDYVRVYEMSGGETIAGAVEVNAGEKSSVYTVNGVSPGSGITWSVPAGATLVEGQNSEKIKVDWGTGSGEVKAHIKSACKESDLSIEVKVQTALQTDIVLENFDDLARIKMTSATGILTSKVPNPGKTLTNNSELSGRYIRNGGSQYDALFYDISDVKSAGDFVTGERKFYMDINTNAPAGTQILLQLEDKNAATSGNYPLGRHSRYATVITKSNEWTRLAFDFLDKPSNNVSDFTINQLVLLFAPNSNTANTYYFDNFEIYSRKTTSLKSYLDPGKLKIYPNPFTDHVRIIPTGIAFRSISLFNNLGIKMFEDFINSDSILSLDLSTLSQGVYFVKLMDQNGLFLMKPILKLK
ncbi:MAG: family 16 glycosylhydrolase [Saprospiraceae bacterium]